MRAKGVLLDLDGTVYYGDRAVPGAADFVALLEERDIRYLFVTNRSNRTPEEICDQLRGMRVACTPERVLTSAQATAQYIGSGSVFHIGEEGLRQALAGAGLTLTDKKPDYVVVSFDRGFTYEKLEKACRLIDEGAVFIATNPDRGLPTEHGIVPGTGAIVAAVAAGSGREPVMIGKPEKRILEMAVARLGLPKEWVVAVGDNLDTDVPAGISAGIRTALVLTGISRREDLARSPVRPDWVAESFADLAVLLQDGCV